jgi:hypothetical protein
MPYWRRPLAPPLNLAGQVQFLGVLAKICDYILVVDYSFVGPELFQQRLDFRVVAEPIAVQEVEDRHRVQCSPFVSVHDWMVSDEQPQQVVRLLVNRFRRGTEVALLDVRQRELEVAPVPDPEGVSGYSATMSSWMARTSSTEGYHSKSPIRSDVEGPPA